MWSSTRFLEVCPKTRSIRPFEASGWAWTLSMWAQRPQNAHLTAFGRCLMPSETEQGAAWGWRRSPSLGSSHIWEFERGIGAFLSGGASLPMCPCFDWCIGCWRIAIQNALLKNISPIEIFCPFHRCCRGHVWETALSPRQMMNFHCLCHFSNYCR